jgi:hypothetical protein
MQYLKPSTLKIPIGMIREADAVGQIKVDPLNDADRLPVFPHGDGALLDNRLVFAFGQVNPDQIEIVRQSAPRCHDSVDRKARWCELVKG